MLVFVSNVVSPHTIPLSVELNNKLKGEFMFIETRMMAEVRKKMGYNSLSSLPFVVPYDQYIHDTTHYKAIIDNAEVVLASYGSIDNSLLENRVTENKLTFLLSERLFKKGILKLFDPKLWRTIYYLSRIRNKAFYLLCMGAYVARDFCLCGFPKDKTYTFGYITQQSTAPVKETRTTTTIKLLWVGRMIWWKQPFDAIKAALKLKEMGYDVELEMIGGGKLENKVRKYIMKHDHYGCVKYSGLQQSEVVQNKMSSCDILLCTSNRLEGWGAVINEGLSAGCLVVANIMMGAAPSLIRDGENGYVYKGRARSLTKVIKKAIDSKRHVEIGENGRNYIKEMWSPIIASDRLINLINELKTDKHSSFCYKEGICSKSQK